MNPTPLIDVLLTQTPPPPAAAVPDYGFFSAVMHAGVGEKIVMGILLLFSVLSWSVIALKWRTVRRASRESEQFLDSFWGSKRLDTIYQKSETLSFSPVSQVFRAGYIELSKLRKKSEGEAADTQLGDLESIERSMRRAAASELTSLEALVPFLATTGSTAPFIGLFGTVIGIVNSFRDIGMMGNANLATVAPGIGGALVATAFGLFAAIPAVIAYNYFLTRIRVLDVEMQNFSSDFLNIIKRHFF
jgi:biopolymer transport protein TolQ